MAVAQVDRGTWTSTTSDSAILHRGLVATLSSKRASVYRREIPQCGKQLPPVLLFVVAAALGRWLPLMVLIAIVLGWLFLIVLAQLLGTRSEPSEVATSDSSETDITT